MAADEEGERLRNQTRTVQGLDLLGKVGEEGDQRGHVTSAAYMCTARV